MRVHRLELVQAVRGAGAAHVDGLGVGGQDLVGDEPDLFAGGEPVLADEGLAVAVPHDAVLQEAAVGLRSGLEVADLGLDAGVRGRGPELAGLFDGLVGRDVDPAVDLHEAVGRAHGQGRAEDLHGVVVVGVLEPHDGRHAGRVDPGGRVRHRRKVGRRPGDGDGRHWEERGC